jgi:hypothetical protein
MYGGATVGDKPVEYHPSVPVSVQGGTGGVILLRTSSLPWQPGCFLQQHRAHPTRVYPRSFLFGIHLEL